LAAITDPTGILNNKGAKKRDAKHPKTMFYTNNELIAFREFRCFWNGVTLAQSILQISPFFLSAALFMKYPLE